MESMSDANDDLQQRKLQAEIDKTIMETRALRPSLFNRTGELIKVAGAVIAMVAGLYAASTTYKITQLETRLAQTEKQTAEKERLSAIADRDAAVVAKRAALVAKRAAESELNRVLDQVRDAQEVIGKLTPQLSNASATATLRKLSGRLEVTSIAAAKVLPLAAVVPADAAQQALASHVASSLSARGVRTNVALPLPNREDVPLVTEVRYFVDADREESSVIMEMVRQAGLSDAKITFHKSETIKRPRYFEIRLGASARTP